MKFSWMLILVAAMALATAPTDVGGTWKVIYVGPPKTGPKTIGSMVLDLRIDGNAVTGVAHIGSWPGDAPIADGKIDGDHITFTATGHLDSTTGIPTCQFDVTTHDDEMVVMLTAVKNGGGPLAPGKSYEYRGKRKLE